MFANQFNLKLVNQEALKTFKFDLILKIVLRIMKNVAILARAIEFSLMQKKILN